MAPPRAPATRWRAVLAILLAALLASCGGGDGGTEAPGGSPGDAAPIATAGDDLAAVLLDGATVEVEQDGDYRATIIITFIGGTTSVTTITLDPDSTLPGGAASADGSPLQAFTAAADETGEGLEWRYRYVVPLAEFPPDAFARTSDGEAPHWLATAMRALLGGGTASAQSGPGVEVVAQGVAKEIGKELASRLEERLRQSSGVTEAISTASDIWEAYQASESYRKLKQRLEELRECVLNPSLELTRRQYEEDPAARQRVLDEISRAEISVKSLYAARYIGALNSQASNFSGQKWLGFVLGPITSWVDKGFERIAQEWVDDVEKLVTGCTTVQWVGTITVTHREEQSSEDSDAIRCGGGRKDCKTEDRSEQVETIREQWTLKPGAPAGGQGGDSAFIAEYSLEAEHREHYYRFAELTASCRGDERGGMFDTWEETTEDWSASTSLEGEAAVSISVGADGSLTISAGAPDGDPEVEGTWTQSYTHGPVCDGGDVPDEEDSGTFSYSPTIWGDVFIEATVTPGQPGVLSGSETETDSGDGWKITRIIEWDLREQE